MSSKLVSSFSWVIWCHQLKYLYCWSAVMIVEEAAILWVFLNLDFQAGLSKSSNYQDSLKRWVIICELLYFLNCRLRNSSITTIFSLSFNKFWGWDLNSKYRGIKRQEMSGLTDSTRTRRQKYLWSLTSTAFCIFLWCWPCMLLKIQISKEKERILSKTLQLKLTNRSNPWNLR